MSDRDHIFDLKKYVGWSTISNELQIGHTLALIMDIVN